MFYYGKAKPKWIPVIDIERDSSGNPIKVTVIKESEVRVDKKDYIRAYDETSNKLIITEKDGKCFQRLRITPNAGCKPEGSPISNSRRRL
jgi:hypothetical protein